MPNAIVRANAQAMPEAASRRAVLGAVLAAGAVASVTAIPAVAKAAATGADHPDAALLALGPEIEAADREWDSLASARNAVEEVYFSTRPNKPELPKTCEITAREAEELLAQGGVDALIQIGRKLEEHEAALKAWDDDLPRARLESGLVAAEKAQDDADDVRLMIRDEKLIPTRARTLEGLIFKARYAARFGDNEDDWEEEVMISIVDDLLALGGEARS